MNILLLGLFIPVLALGGGNVSKVEHLPTELSCHESKARIQYLFNDALIKVKANPELAIDTLGLLQECDYRYVSRSKVLILFGLLISRLTDLSRVDLGTLKRVATQYHRFDRSAFLNTFHLLLSSTERPISFHLLWILKELEPSDFESFVSSHIIREQRVFSALHHFAQQPYWIHQFKDTPFSLEALMWEAYRKVFEESSEEITLRFLNLPHSLLEIHETRLKQVFQFVSCNFPNLIPEIEEFFWSPSAHLHALTKAFLDDIASKKQISIHIRGKELVLSRLLNSQSAALKRMGCEILSKELLLNDSLSLDFCSFDGAWDSVQLTQLIQVIGESDPNPVILYDLFETHLADFFPIDLQLRLFEIILTSTEIQFEFGLDVFFTYISELRRVNHRIPLDRISNTSLKLIIENTYLIIDSKASLEDRLDSIETLSAYGGTYEKLARFYQWMTQSKWGATDDDHLVNATFGYFDNSKHSDRVTFPIHPEQLRQSIQSRATWIRYLNFMLSKSTVLKSRVSSALQLEKAILGIY